MNKLLIAAAALLVSTGASAQSANTGRAGATARHAVLDNIMSRVQMDALIDTVVDTDVTQPTLVSDAVASGNTRVSRQRPDVAVAAAAAMVPGKRS